MVDATGPIVLDGAVPVLSFPSILRNPGIANRFAHLQGELTPRTQNQQGPFKKYRRDQNDGKRWLRRHDNARFVGNPHIVAATKHDFLIHPPQTQPTFTEPLPSYLPRTVKLPTATNPPPANPICANAGRFSLSLKGMRKELRRQGGRVEMLVKDIEDEMVKWLQQGGTVLAPSYNIIGQAIPSAEGTPIGHTKAIVEVSRTPLQLIWRIPDDAFARYVVHCCARYHEIVSFSKGNSPQRMTYLLRPNVTRPDHRAPATLDTPPVTDMDYSSNPDIDTDGNIDSDFISDREFESDIDVKRGDLPSIKETVSLLDATSDTWSFIGDSDADEESNSEFDLDAQLDSLALPSPPAHVISKEDPDRTITDIARLPHRTHPLHTSRRAVRSASSPSRSPARTRPLQRRRQLLSVNPMWGGKPSFYEYIFL